MATQRSSVIKKLIATFPIRVGIKPSNSKAFSIDEMPFTVSAENSELLNKITRALDHLKTSGFSNSAELNVEIWTLQDQNFAKQRSFFTWLKEKFGNSLLRFTTQEYYFFYNPGLENSFASLSFFDKSSKRSIYWIEDADHIPWYEIAAPFRIIFNWFLTEKKYEMIHAACIGTNKQGILLVGKGGKGKSSTALTALNNTNLFFLSDDYTVLKMQPFPKAISLYSSAKVDGATLVRIPQLQNLQDKTQIENEAKTALFIGSHHQDKIATMLSISAIVIPEVTGATISSYEKISSALSLLMAAPSTVFQLLPESKSHTAFESLAALVKLVPSYKMNLSADPQEISEKIAKLCNSLSKQGNL